MKKYQTTFLTTILAFASIVFLHGQSVPNNGLVAYYPFNGNASDNVGINHGTVNGAVLTTNRFGIANSAYRFNGINSSIDFNSPPLTQVANWTISAWIKPSALPQEGFAVQLGFDNDSVGDGFGFGFSFSSTLTGIFSGLDYLNSGQTLVTNQWYHIVMMRDTNVTRFFVNNVQAPGTSTVTPHIPTDFTIGSQNGVRFFNGSVDDVRIYNRTLSAGEILALYQESSGDSDPPVITQDPQSQTAYFGSNATFTVSCYGTPPISYQWKKNGANIPAATNSALSFGFIVGTNSASYTVIMTNNFGSATSAVAVLTVKALDVYGNNQLLTNNQYSYGGSVTVKLQGVITNGIYYTLDSSTPDFTKTHYSSPFSLTNTATLRAVIYSSDFTQSGESAPLNFVILPTYSLTTSSPGGGKIVISPTNAPYISNTVVTISAVASNGWTFLQWLGDASGTNPTNTVTMTRAKTVQAIFGTPLGTTVAGNGSVTKNPSAAFYPYGSIVNLSAIPQTGSYFFQWANNGTGTNNPYAFTVIKTNQSVAGLFSTLSGSQLSLVTFASGEGSVGISPFANTYTNGQNVILTATPNTNQTFLGWAGDASGTQNPLNVIMDSNKIITATFTRNPRLTQNSSRLAVEGDVLTLTGEFGTNYLLQISDDLINWTNLTTLTNAAGSCQFNDSAATNLPRRFYRAVEAP